MNSDPIANLLNIGNSLGEWAIGIVVNEGRQEKNMGIYPFIKASRMIPT